MSDITVDRSNIINVNIGILGHVDSGKTSLVKALSTLLSTAALDKNPQSQQRGITFRVRVRVRVSVRQKLFWIE
jgi:translation elongation factor EF-Tu-like GTPase